MKTKIQLLAVTAALLLAGCANKLLKQAEEHYEDYEFATAARIYETYLKTDSNAVAMLHLADCYRQMNRHSEAEKWYARSITAREATDADKLHYAEVLRENGKYDEASAVYGDYVGAHPNDAMANNQLLACRTSDQLLAANPFYEVKQVPLEFTGSCFSASRMGEDLLITAEAPVKTGEPTSNWTGRGFLDLYVLSAKKEEAVLYSNGTDGHGNGAIQMDFSASPLPGDVNTKLHEGPAVIAPGGNVMYFTRSSRAVEKDGKSGKAAKAKDRDNHLELCSAELVDGKWTNVSVLPFNSIDFSCGQPAVSGDGKRLYFISDKPGGYGATDIYYTDRGPEGWRAPVNAGSNINTNGNEMFPTIRQIMPGVDELYFSSDGLAGAGGLDIFHSSVDGVTLETPKRMSAPINGNSDDFGLVFINDGKDGYFSSNRSNGDGIDKLYSFRRLDPRFFVNLKVIDKESGATVPQADVEVTDTRTFITTKMKADSTGHLVFAADSMTSYGFTLRCSSYFCGFSSVNTGGFKGKLNDTSFAVVGMEKIVINKPIRLENIYYDYNKWNIRTDAAVELDKLVKIMKDNPQIRIELSSHTDCRGSDTYNMKLSQKRAQSAVDYIVSQGIGRERIYAKGYGESVPLNKCVNGVKCTEEEYQWNRRTEFKVVEILQ